MAKTANLYARIEPEVKEEAERILDALGVPVSNAINMFYKQIIIHRGLPFDVKLPVERPVHIHDLTEAELNAVFEKGFSDMLERRTVPAAVILNDVIKDHNND